MRFLFLALGSALLLAPIASGCSSQSTGNASRCPAAVPTAGDTCTMPQQCEFGGDALGRNRVAAFCAIDTNGGPATWHVYDEALAPNDAACPSAFDSIPTGGACPASKAMACDYDAGRCTCSCVADGKTEWHCRARTDVYVSDESTPPPSTKPRLGDACSYPSSIDFRYGEVCRDTALSFGYDYRCDDGYWISIANGAGACATQPKCF